MISALGYLAQRFVFRATDFFHHWYVDGSRTAIHALTQTLEQADRRFAVAITVRNFLSPLYGDYSIVGRFLGLVFRSGRIVIGTLCYAFLVFVFLVGFIAWLTVPLALPFAAMQSFSALLSIR